MHYIYIYTSCTYLLSLSLSRLTPSWRPATQAEQADRKPNQTTYMDPDGPKIHLPTYLLTILIGSIPYTS